ncbi:hypothetical protein QNH36_22590 [Mesobacillus sp. AQ2]|uniref:hypothetical protein n=1 Tax=Bacillaceae TaxID=186817 RepID=UPI0011A4DE19|nr:MULTISPECIES: hypothetical protein [Bacillaceae]WHX40396.1 hypothetical protein QNH36_22590 [Mesobacillus sp. AQ2]
MRKLPKAINTEANLATHFSATAMPKAMLPLLDKLTNRFFEEAGASGIEIKNGDSASSHHFLILQ